MLLPQAAASRIGTAGSVSFLRTMGRRRAINALPNMKSPNDDNTHPFIWNLTAVNG
jgi:hypothetical protein